jgi:nucleoside-diphosphate-sugar epimerase
MSTAAYSRAPGRGMRIFVTGATGVIGRRVVPRLVDSGHDVTAVARGPHKRAIVEQWRAAPIDVSLFDRDALRQAMARHDAVVNLATHIPHSSAAMLAPWSWRENDRIRREGSAAIVDAAIAAGVGRLVQESFALVYPDRGGDWIDETAPLAPVRYNRTIADAERSALHFTEGSRRSAVVLRFAAFYGPDAVQVKDYVRVIGRGWAPLPGDPTAYLSSIAHDDAATAVVAALGIGPGIYNVADDEPLSRREFADAVATAFGLPSPKLPPRWIARLLGSTGELLSRSERISNQKLRTESAWAPAYRSAREGMRAVARALAPT